MIDRIRIENFKAVKTLSLDARPLNLFMGLNGMGKSTVIQSLLLLRQSLKSRCKSLSLNGEYVEIGRGSDALYGFADEERIGFCLDFVGKTGEVPYVLKADYKYEKDSDVLEAASALICDEVFEEPLFTDRFVFLNAERLAPAAAYDMSYDKVINGHSLGIHGELAVHFLSMYGDKLTVPEGLCLDSAHSHKLIDQVQEWMSVISPGVEIETEELAKIDKVIISYGFQTNKSRTNKFRPTNVGFGISYILPVLVACLSGMHQLIVIENPEAHLHPKGQVKMGELIARCAAYGCQLFIETHSDHLVNGLRVAVREGLINRKSVAINYFTKKNEDGQSFVENTPVFIGENGSLSKYPADFLDEWENQLMKLL